MSRGTRSLLALCILASGIGTLLYLVKTKPEARKSDLVDTGTAVEVIEIQTTTSHVTVRGKGTVRPARKVVLGPEVGGKIVRISSNLIPGGRVREGELLARIDESDYRLAVDQQRASVDSAAMQLEIEQGRRRIAEREWKMFQDEDKESANKTLALREPQYRAAKVALKSAKSGLKRAKLGVERTLLRAPFDGIVQTTSAELGQMVAPGTPLLTFVGSKTYWVQVSLPVERLAWISVPGVAGKEVGSTATIRHQVGNQVIEKTGRVIRLLSDLDPAGHMARVLVEVDDPLGLYGGSQELGKEEHASSQQGSLPLLLGTFVEVEIAGLRADNVVELPRDGVRNGNLAYILTSNGTLEKRAIDILWRDEDMVLVASGLNTGDKVVVSPISSAFEGMKLRVPSGASPTKVPKADEVDAGAKQNANAPVPVPVQTGSQG